MGKILAHMIVDGRAIAQKILEVLKIECARSARVPKLAIITCAPNLETEKYLALKKRRAAEVGIQAQVHTFGETTDTHTFIEAVRVCTEEADGVIVQLPLPSYVDTEAVLASIPPSRDADALNPKTDQVLSPVVGAIDAILTEHQIDPLGTHVVVIGHGRLVGAPAERYFGDAGAFVRVVTEDTKEVGRYTKEADIIVCGAGVPGLLTPSMIKEGAVILDAGTSEAGGVLRGDADPSCAAKAALFTPVPGGIGPITIAVLLQNVARLAR